ncbi:hypothetical protein AOLI_G00204230 [Acnodon oligacanthus]
MSRSRQATTERAPHHSATVHTYIKSWREPGRLGHLLLAGMVTGTVSTQSLSLRRSADFEEIVFRFTPSKCKPVRPSQPKETRHSRCLIEALEGPGKGQREVCDYRGKH